MKVLKEKHRKQKRPNKVLLKKIVIPAGTIFTESARKTERHGEGHYGCSVGLSKDTCGTFDYFIDPDDVGMKEYFIDE